MNRMLSSVMFPTWTMLRVGCLGLIFAAASPASETLYLSDTAGTSDGISKLYRVELFGPSNEAQLSLLPSGTIAFDHADAIAASPEGEKVWVINDSRNDARQLGFYDTANAAFSVIGPIDFLDIEESPFGNEIDQAAMSPNGTLYITRASQSELWTLDTTTAEATLVGTIETEPGRPVSLAGGDIAFSANGTLYLWTNADDGVSSHGLYVLELPTTVPDQVLATYQGPNDGFFTGLAVRANGLGDLVASETGQDSIIVVDEYTGAEIDNFAMMVGDSDFDHSVGDMTVGATVLCRKTIGYWKNHEWSTPVLINGELVAQSSDAPSDAPAGGDILRNARGNNLSMLFAQLLAAKLNTNNATGVPAIELAEEFLFQEQLTATNWRDPFADKEQKREAASLWEALDAFNNDMPCDNDSPEEHVQARSER